MSEKNTMRRVAGVIYAVAFVVELFCWQPIFADYSAIYVPLLLGLLTIGGVAVLSVWLFSSDAPVKRAASRAIIAGTALMILKTLVLYDMENSLITFSLLSWSEKLPFFASVAGSNMWNYVFIVVRLMLLIVAAFFVSNALDSAKPAAGGIVDESMPDSEDTLPEAEVMEEEELIVAVTQPDEAEQAEEQAEQ